MKRLISVVMALTTMVLLVVSANAQEPEPTVPVQPQHTDPNWQAMYWNNKSLEGEPILRRSETNLNNNWGDGAPAPGVNADQFAARWTRYIDVPAGLYRFVATSDDGLRVWIDNDLIINAWNDHPATTYIVNRNLSVGHHLIKVEYYENLGQAVAQLAWARVPGAINNWRGEYFNNISLSGEPVLVRDDATINFNWAGSSPEPEFINSDNFSARWTRELNLAADTYRFSVTADDGVRLWVNGHLLIDQWRDQGATTYSGEIFLPGGVVPVKLEYYERGGVATARLAWSSRTTPEAVIVDDTDTGFVKGGNASGWHTASEGHNGRLTWARNNDWTRNGYNWARWYPTLKAGRYEVFAYIPERYTTTTHATYWISHLGGFTSRVVSQFDYHNEWVSLGTYDFRGTRSDYVSLNDVTGEPRFSRIIAWDAMKWEPR